MSEVKTEQDKAFTGLITQEQAQYVPLSNTPGQACANCRWFKAWGDYCHLVEDYPEPILATGHSNRWEAVEKPEVLEVLPMPVVIVDTVQMALDVPKNLVERVKSYFEKITARATPEPAAFQVFKTSTGKKAWIARHTGKWIDRENEILAEAALDAYVERVQSGKVSPPELWMWHNKATKHGQAVAVWKSGGFVLAAGYLDETPAGNKAFDYYQKNSGKIKLSHMFHYPREAKIDGVYYEVNTIEITTLPDGAEAFPYTSFQEIQAMTLPEAARNMIKDALGEETLSAALAADKQAEVDTTKLDAAGIASKNYDNYDGSKIVEAVQKAGDAAAEHAALKTRLEAAEATVKALAALPEQVKQLGDAVTELTKQVQEANTARQAAQDQATALEKRVAELTDLKPPASQSPETLLGQRETSFIDKVMQDAKQGEAVSLVDRLVGTNPTTIT